MASAMLSSQKISTVFCLHASMFFMSPVFMTDS